MPTADADQQALKVTAPKPHTNATAEIRQRLGPRAGPLTSLNSNGLTGRPALVTGSGKGSVRIGQVVAGRLGVGGCGSREGCDALVADLATPALRGRYRAAMGLSWWLGLAWRRR